MIHDDVDCLERERVHDARRKAGAHRRLRGLRETIGHSRREQRNHAVISDLTVDEI